MTREAYIFEAIRTPRAKGKVGEALYEVKPIDLVVGLMKELVRRYELDTAQIDDVVL
ncbi:MAG: acetyl-CoA C-acyltransferase, partial [Deltaproteobacteria bacterium]